MKNTSGQICFFSEVLKIRTFLSSMKASKLFNLGNGVKSWNPIKLFQHFEFKNWRWNHGYQKQRGRKSEGNAPQRNYPNIFFISVFPPFCWCVCLYLYACLYLPVLYLCLLCICVYVSMCICIFSSLYFSLLPSMSVFLSPTLSPPLCVSM